MMIIIIIIIIIIMAFKGAIRDFLTAPRTLPNTYSQVARANHVQIMYNKSSGYHVQHVCHAVQRDSSAIKSDRAEIAFLFGWFIG